MNDTCGLPAGNGPWYGFRKPEVTKGLNRYVVETCFFMRLWLIDMFIGGFKVLYRPAGNFGRRQPLWMLLFAFLSGLLILAVNGMTGVEHPGKGEGRAIDAAPVPCGCGQ